MKKRLLCLLSACAILTVLTGIRGVGAAGWDSPMTAYGKTDQFESVKKKPSRTEKAQVQFALTELKKQWKELYENDMYEKGSGYLEIKNTRLIKIKEETEADLFKNVDYMVEFVLYSNYFGSAPYYGNCGTYDCVVVYKDGSVDFKNLVSIYRSRTYSADFTGFIENICDYDDAFNEVMILK